MSVGRHTPANEKIVVDGKGERRAPRTGETWKNPNLAGTLEQIAQGKVADATIEIEGEERPAVVARFLNRFDK